MIIKIIPCGLDNNHITSIKKLGKKSSNINKNLKKIILKNLSRFNIFINKIIKLFTIFSFKVIFNTINHKFNFVGMQH